MATRKKPETKAQMEARHITRIAKAYTTRRGEVGWGWQPEASWRYAELRAAVYAVVPGKQKARNIAALLDAAVTAVCRVIRRRR